MKSILAKQTDGTLQLNITIPESEVKKAYDEVFSSVSQDSELPGFRKGKAPKKLVEEKVDKTKVYEQVLQKIVPNAYLEAVNENKLKPVVSPKVELLKAEEGADWEIRATTCERPEVVLGDYKEEIRKEMATGKLWTPQTQKNEKDTDNTEATHDEKTQKVMEILLKTVKLDLPSVLAEDELNRALSNLIAQTEKLGLTIDQYLNSINKTVEQIRAEYRERIEGDLKIQLILDEIAKAEKTEVKEEEIDALITASGDEKIKENLNKPENRLYLKGILARRKTLDFLAKL
ncbi:MAG: trigger factor [bacterium]|nr:trigger factor [bacterium]